MNIECKVNQTTEFNFCLFPPAHALCLGLVRMPVPSCVLWSTPLTGTPLSFTCKQMSQWSVGLTGDWPSSGTQSPKWNGRGESLAMTLSGDCLILHRVFSPERSVCQTDTWPFFHPNVFVFQVSYHGRRAICCEQGLLWIPGHIWHGYGGVGRRKPGALLQGEFSAGHSSTYPLSNLRQWAVFKTLGKEWLM